MLKEEGWGVFKEQGESTFSLLWAMASVSVSVLSEHKRELKWLVMMATFYFCGFKREKSPAIFLLTINTFIMQLGISRIYKACSVDVLEYFDIELFFCSWRLVEQFLCKLFNLWTIQLASIEQNSPTYSSVFMSPPKNQFPKLGNLVFSFIFIISLFFLLLNEV